jgi:hypothetical protein
MCVFPVLGSLIAHHVGSVEVDVRIGSVVPIETIELVAGYHA